MEFFLLNFYETPSHFACKSRSVNMIKRLVELKAFDVKAVNKIDKINILNDV